MKLQKLLSYVRRAVDDYHMIEEGDKIAVGVSGGERQHLSAHCAEAFAAFLSQALRTGSHHRFSGTARGCL